ncbi:MAG: lipopolysaccharide heptosyltransferase II [Planctomycetes bacterium]|nr:lipopolysaccharide heptosyltransferase II [Planctomycetota bacterium]
MEQEKILVWLPSPMGDAILCTPALRAIRRRFESKRIYFLASPTVKQMLSPSNFNDEWIEYTGKNIFKLSQRLKKENFSTAILLKNSFGSALAVMLAGIDRRVGYSRDCRGIFLTDKIEAPMAKSGKFKAASMVNYYLGITSLLGCEADDMQLELLLEDGDLSSLAGKMPSIFSPIAPLVVLVPGGAFGPSKCWPSKRFAQTADWLVENYDATVAISVAPNKTEKQIAKDIVSVAKNKLYSLADTPLTLGELKSFIAEANLVITNDTGPRHIAIALGKKLITLFGPNNPDWTQTGYENEIQIVGTADCVPCDKPECSQLEHLCMKSITVEMVREAAEKMLKNTK